MNAIEPYLPWIGLVVGVMGLVVPDKEGRAPVRAGHVWTALAISVLLGAGAYVTSRYVYGDSRSALQYLAGGVGASVLVSLVCRWRSTSWRGSVLAALGFTAFVVGNQGGPLGLDVAAKLGGLVCGLAVGGAVFFPVVSARVGGLLVAAVFVAGSLSQMALIGYGSAIQQAVGYVVWSAIVAFGVEWSVGSAAKGKLGWVGKALGVVALAALSWLVFAVTIEYRSLAMVALVSVLAVLATAWSVARDGRSVASWGIAAVVWLGVATYSFSQAFGLGMAVAGFVGLATVLLLERTDLLPAVGLVVGLSFYRLFRERNTEVVQAFDIGQHYAMIGFVLGVVVVVALTDALVRRRSETNPVRYAVIGLIAATIVVGAAAFFGSKGAIGLVVGLGIAPLVARLTPSGTAWSLSAAAALQSAALVAYRPLAWETTLEREAKVRLLLWLSVGVIVLAAALMLMERKKKEVASEAV